MKAIINSNLYDTDKATKIAEYNNNRGYDDFRYICETLYKTKKGNLFIHACGGAMTEYAQSCAGGTCGGEEIVPMSEAEVLDWCETRRIQSKALLELLSDSIEDA